MHPHSLHDAPLPPGLRRFWLDRDWGWLHLVAGGQGPPLFLVHGLGGSCQDFYVMAQHLSERYTLLIPDLPGFGLSAKPDLDYGPELFSAELASLAVDLGIGRAHWLGHSMGGQVVMRLDLEHPDLVDRLVAVCPAGGQQGPDLLQSLLLSLLTNQEDRLRVFDPWLIGPMIRRWYGDPHHPSRAELTQRLKAQWSTAERPLLERSFIRAGRNLLNDPVLPHLSRLQAPLMLIQGSRDRVISNRNLERLVAALPPGFRRHILPCGHLPIYSMPYMLSLLVDEFLAGK